MSTPAWHSHAPHRSVANIPAAVAGPVPVVVVSPLDSPAPASRPDPTAWAPSGYEIIDEIGRGGMGVVYRARQVRLDRLVALKMLHEDMETDPVLWTRLRMEAATMARLQHPHIVPIYEYGEQDGFAFLAMEYMAGGNLAQRRPDFGLPALHPESGRDSSGRIWTAAEIRHRCGRIAELIESLCSAIQFAHEKGILHRDLKPANVLLSPEDLAKITDFGLAQSLHETGQTTAEDPGQAQPAPRIVGTPSYIGPEQAECRSDLIGPATDVYALGAVLYELLTGRPPFLAETTVDTLLQVVLEDPVAPGKLQAGLASELQNICMKCLQKDPAQRYASAVDLAADLRSFRLGRKVFAADQDSTRQRRRRPWQTMASVAVGTAGAALAFWAGWNGARVKSHLDGGMSRVSAAAKPATSEESLPVLDRTQETQERAGLLEELAQADTKLGRLRAAETRYRLAIQAWQSLAYSESPVKARLAHCQRQLASLLAESGFHLEAEGAYRQAIDLQKELLGRDFNSPALRHALAVTLAGMGAMHRETGNWQEAEEGLRQAQRILDELATGESPAPGVLFGQSSARFELAVLYMDMGQIEAAETRCREAITMVTALLARDPTHLDVRLLAAAGRARLGMIVLAAGKPIEAENTLQEALALATPLRQAGLARGGQIEADAWFHLACLRRSQHRTADAAAAAQQALALRENLKRVQPEVAAHQRVCEEIRRFLAGS